MYLCFIILDILRNERIDSEIYLFATDFGLTEH